jgi:peptide/nickel transport system substrate-binding protein
MKTLRISAMLLALFLIAPIMVSAADLAENQHIRISVPVRDIKTLDPAFATLTGEKTIVSEITSGLLRFPYGVIDLERIEGDLAESWTVSDDGLTWTFILRKGVKWHKGFGEVGAEDVVFSLSRVMDPETGSPWRKKFMNIESIEAVDGHTVKIVLKEADPFFGLSLIGYQGGQIIPKKAVEQYGEDFAFNPVGTGPFQFDSYKKATGVILKKNPDYFMGEPILDTVEYVFMPDDSSRIMALMRGEIDLGTGTRRKEFAQKAQKMGLELMPPNPPQQCILVYNMKREPLNDLRVRKALSYALDRDIFVDLLGSVLGGPQISPIPPGYFGHLEMGMEQYEYYPELAKKLLADAGYPDGFDLGDVNVSESWAYLQPMKIVQEQWRQVGVNMNLKVVDHPTYHKLIREDANSIIIYGGVRLPIASTLLTQFYHSRSAIGKKTAVTNFAHYGDVIPGIDEYLANAEATRNLELKKYYYGLAQLKILEDLPAYPIFLNRVSMVRQKWVDLGYETDPYETLYYVIEVNEKTKILKH